MIFAVAFLLVCVSMEHSHEGQMVQPIASSAALLDPGLDLLLIEDEPGAVQIFKLWRILA